MTPSAAAAAGTGAPASGQAKPTIQTAASAAGCSPPAGRVRAISAATVAHATAAAAQPASQPPPASATASRPATPTSATSSTAQPAATVSASAATASRHAAGRSIGRGWGIRARSHPTGSRSMAGGAAKRAGRAPCVPERAADRSGTVPRMAGPDVVVVGSLNHDITVEADRRPAGGETVLGRSLATACGGKGANQAVAAARAGARVAMVGCVGDDAAGEAMVGNLEAAGVATDARAARATRPRAPR